jgi:hypothetical protein
MAKTFSSVSMRTDERRRLSLLSGDLQTSQSQATTGIPCDVPVPKNVIRIDFFLQNYKKNWFLAKKILSLYPKFQNL